MAKYKFVEQSECKTFSFVTDKGTKKEETHIVSLVCTDKNKNIWETSIRCDQGGSFIKLDK